MGIDINEYKTLYIKTARELIHTMKTSLTIMRQDPCNQRAIGDFHRGAHSFKSQSLVMGYTKTGLIAKILEQIFRDLKDQLTCATSEIIPLIEETVAKLEESINSIENQQGEIDLTYETEQLSKLTSIPVV